VIRVIAFDGGFVSAALGNSDLRENDLVTD